MYVLTAFLIFSFSVLHSSRLLIHQRTVTTQCCSTTRWNWVILTLILPLRLTRRYCKIHSASFVIHFFFSILPLLREVWLQTSTVEMLPVQAPLSGQLQLEDRKWQNFFLCPLKYSAYLPKKGYITTIVTIVDERLAIYRKVGIYTDNAWLPSKFTFTLNITMNKTKSVLSEGSCLG